jgi:hypothetical protein
LIIGYGKLNGRDYWLLKNQWSKMWGIGGYVMVNQNDNDCGVTETPIIPIIV